jgi:hypothetical protein
MLARRVVLLPHSVSSHPGIPILELTPPHPAKNNSPHFMCLREPILQPLCFQVYAGMGECTYPPSSPSIPHHQPWRVDDSDPMGTPAPCYKSHGIISFADPHPLTPLGSYRFETRVGGIQDSTCSIVLLTPLDSALPRSLSFYTQFRTLSLLESTLLKVFILSNLKSL